MWLSAISVSTSSSPRTCSGSGSWWELEHSQGPPGNPVLLGDGVRWFTPREGGRYELHGETRVGPPFEGCSDVLPD